MSGTDFANVATLKEKFVDIKDLILFVVKQDVSVASERQFCKINLSSANHL